MNGTTEAQCGDTLGPLSMTQISHLRPEAGEHSGNRALNAPESMPDMHTLMDGAQRHGLEFVM